MKIIISLLFCSILFVEAKLRKDDSFFENREKVHIGDGKTYTDSRSSVEFKRGGLNIKSDTRSHTDNSIVIGEDIRSSGNGRINIANREYRNTKDDDFYPTRKSPIDRTSSLGFRSDKEDRERKTKGDIIATGNSVVNIGNFDRSKRNVDDEETNDRVKRGVWDVKVDVKNTWNKDNSMTFKDTIGTEGSVVNVGNGDRSKRSIERGESIDRVKRGVWDVKVDVKNTWNKDNSMTFKDTYGSGGSTVNVGNGDRSKRNVDDDETSDRVKRGVWDVKVDVKNTWNKDNSMTFKDTYGSGGSTVNVGNGDRSKRSLEHGEMIDRVKRGVWDVKIDVQNKWNKDNSMTFKDTIGTGGSTVNVGNGDRSKRSVVEPQDVQTDENSNFVSNEHLRGKRQTVHIKNQHIQVKDNSMRFENVYAQNSNINIGNGDRSKREVEKEPLSESVDRTKRGVWDVNINNKNTWNKDNSMKFQNTVGTGGSTVNVGNGDRSKRSLSEPFTTVENDVTKHRVERSNVYVDTQNVINKDNSVHVNGLYSHGSAVINIGNGRRSKKNVQNELTTESNDRIKRGVWDVKVDVVNTWNKDNSMTFKDTVGTGRSTVNVGNGDRS